MSFWSITLRITATIYLVYTFASDPSNIAQSVMIALLCFAVAAGLDRLAQLDDRTRQHSAALRRLLPGRKSTTDDELAPHAPTGWAQFKKRPLDPEREKDSGYDQRLARRWRYIERPTKNASPAPLNDARTTRAASRQAMR
jgi:hypothetical protein